MSASVGDAAASARTSSIDTSLRALFRLRLQLLVVERLEDFALLKDARLWHHLLEVDSKDERFVKGIRR